MELQDTVCTLEQAKKLSQLGVIQDAYFAHLKDDDGDGYWTIMPVSYVNTDDYKEQYSAFTVAELGVMLPPFTYSWMGNEAECRAAQLIYLLENNLVTPAEINQRLTQK